VPEGSRATDEKSGANFIKRFLNDEVLTAVQKLKPIADEGGLTVAQLSLAWVLHNENIAAALVGASRPEQLEDTVKASGVKLEQSAYDAINDALAGVAVTDPAETDKVSPKTRPA
jgi:aryl-alcohol dehydrogenase-like predicted oxidoreductase